MASNDLKRIKELASDNVLISSFLLLKEIKELKRSLGLELDLARDCRRSQEAEFREFMAELWGFLDKLAAKYCVDRKLLNLVEEPNAGDKKRGQKETETKAGGIVSFRK